MNIRGIFIKSYFKLCFSRVLKRVYPLFCVFSSNKIISYSATSPEFPIFPNPRSKHHETKPKSMKYNDRLKHENKTAAVKPVQNDENDDVSRSRHKSRILSRDARRESSQRGTRRTTSSRRIAASSRVRITCWCIHSNVSIDKLTKYAMGRVSLDGDG